MDGRLCHRPHNILAVGAIAPMDSAPMTAAAAVAVAIYHITCCHLSRKLLAMHTAHLLTVRDIAAMCAAVQSSI